MENFNSGVSDLSMLFKNEQETYHQSRADFQFHAPSCIQKSQIAVAQWTFEFTLVMWSPLLLKNNLLKAGIKWIIHALSGGPQ